MFRWVSLAICVLLIGGSIGLTPCVHAQAGKVYRIGVLTTGTAEQNVTRMDAFRRGLRELGWSTSSSAIAFEERWADGHYERLPALAAELVALKVDLILASGGTPAVEAAMKSTRTIPIVFAAVADPVGEKIVPSLAHPGGNVTGLTNMGTELYAKRLALLNQAVPATRLVALIINGANPFADEAVRISQSTGRSLGIQVDSFDVRDPQDFDRAFEKASQAGMQAVLLGTDTLLLFNVKHLGELALKHRLPLI